jgi:hypothetical protein
LLPGELLLSCVCYYYYIYTTTYRVDVIEERRSVIPRLLDIAREVGETQSRAPIQGGQSVGQRHDAVVHQSRLGLDDSNNNNNNNRKQNKTKQKIGMKLVE